MEGGREIAWTEKEAQRGKEGEHKCKKAHKKQLGRVVVLCTQITIVANRRNGHVH